MVVAFFIMCNAMASTFGWACLAVAIAFSAFLMSLNACELLVALLRKKKQQPNPPA
jgi:hypothetical protein